MEKNLGNICFSPIFAPEMNTAIKNIKQTCKQFLTREAA